MRSNWAPPGPALLFCPADRPDRYAKAATTADMVIIDLEDGVGPTDKPTARRALSEVLLDPTRTIVRLNPSGTPDYALDLRVLAQTPYDMVMLAKTESADQVNALSPRRVIALCETPRGILSAEPIAGAATTVAITWGAEDLVATTGGRSSRRANGGYSDFARHAQSHVLLAAGANGKVAIDTVYLDIADIEGLSGEASEAARAGFVAKMCIHPSQVQPVRTAFRPSEQEVAWAERVCEAAVGANGAFAFEGRMVDAPILAHAKRILEQARGATKTEIEH